MVAVPHVVELAIKRKIDKNEEVKKIISRAKSTKDEIEEIEKKINKIKEKIELTKPGDERAAISARRKSFAKKSKKKNEEDDFWDNEYVKATNVGGNKGKEGYKDQKIEQYEQERDQLQRQHEHLKSTLQELKKGEKELRGNLRKTAIEKYQKERLQKAQVASSEPVSTTATGNSVPASAIVPPPPPPPAGFQVKEKRTASEVPTPPPTPSSETSRPVSPPQKKVLIKSPERADLLRAIQKKKKSEAEEEKQMEVDRAEKKKREEMASSQQKRVETIQETEDDDWDTDQKKAEEKEKKSIAIGQIKKDIKRVFGQTAEAAPVAKVPTASIVIEQVEKIADKAIEQIEEAKTIAIEQVEKKVEMVVEQVKEVAAIAVEQVKEASAATVSPVEKPATPSKSPIASFRASVPASTSTVIPSPLPVRRPLPTTPKSIATKKEAPVSETSTAAIVIEQVEKVADKAIEQIEEAKTIVIDQVKEVAAIAVEQVKEVSAAAVSQVEKPATPSKSPIASFQTSVPASTVIPSPLPARRPLPPTPKSITTKKEALVSEASTAAIVIEQVGKVADKAIEQIEEAKTIAIEQVEEKVEMIVEQVKEVAAIAIEQVKEPATLPFSSFQDFANKLPKSKKPSSLPSRLASESVVIDKELASNLYPSTFRKNKMGHRIGTMIAAFDIEKGYDKAHSEKSSFFNLFNFFKIPKYKIIDTLNSNIKNHIDGIRNLDDPVKISSKIDKILRILDHEIKANHNEKRSSLVGVLKDFKGVLEEMKSKYLHHFVVMERIIGQELFFLKDLRMVQNIKRESLIPKLAKEIHKEKGKYNIESVQKSIDILLDFSKECKEIEESSRIFINELEDERYAFGKKTQEAFITHKTNIEKATSLLREYQEIPEDVRMLVEGKLKLGKKSLSDIMRQPNEHLSRYETAFVDAKKHMEKNEASYKGIDACLAVAQTRVKELKIGKRIASKIMAFDINRKYDEEHAKKLAFFNLFKQSKHTLIKELNKEISSHCEIIKVQNDPRIISKEIDKIIKKLHVKIAERNKERSSLVPVLEEFEKILKLIKKENYVYHDCFDALKEIKNTEISFSTHLNILQGINQENLKKMPKNDSVDIFLNFLRKCKEIEKSSEEFLYQFEHEKYSFGTGTQEKFKKHIENINEAAMLQEKYFETSNEDQNAIAKQVQRDVTNRTKMLFLDLENKDIRLNGIMTNPAQRIPRYSLNLSRVKTFFDKENPVHNRIDTCLKMCSVQSLQHISTPARQSAVISGKSVVQPAETAESKEPHAKVSQTSKNKKA